MTRFRFICSVVSLILSILFIMVLFSSCSAGSIGSSKDETTTTQKVEQEKYYSYDKKFYAKKFSVKDEPGNFSLAIYQTEDNEKCIELAPSFEFTEISWDEATYRVTVSTADGLKSESYAYSENRWIKSSIN